ncbi:DUF2189 domain-containing protein [Sagittula sp. SSi028]|uniref:DUF2189 domain-containing protein n=1 Tax=Sagittula sp. SSi028 TaxID=3400636 RepID=UPI003AF4DEFB
MADFKSALRSGLRDISRAPAMALLLALPWVLGGWFMAWLTTATGQSYWLVFAAIGFPLLGPFAAVGYYDISRRLQSEYALDRKAVFAVILRQSRRQLPSLCAVILVMFLFWFFLSHMIFALFMGLSTMTNVSSSLQVYLTMNGLAMLAVGSLIGAGFACVLYMISVLALPMLLDREVDFVTAMIASFGFVQRQPVLMLGWGVCLGTATLIALLPMFLGLLFVLPLFGHASWHLYDLLAHDTSQASTAEAGDQTISSPTFSKVR